MADQPLDLRAVETSLLGISTDDASWKLLAHCRALRAALQGFTNRHRSVSRDNYADCACVQCRRAAAVLAQAQDEP